MFGVLAICQAMVPILRDTPNARIVNISRRAGSLMLSSDAGSPLRPLLDASDAASKTVLNALTLAMVIELEADGSSVHAVFPGYTRDEAHSIYRHGYR
ncbi:hypothetical protein [Agrobacterium sp. B1(2019)]|uniref:hypothetical protein n=1 Tax=Agrobacterium sp. B1(2019) TaxID=2607032 RepID=UPI0011EF1395|nr:hypothetical protein [Agrobacterium sp. B1(2019)]TZG33513.1 hypothetical protein AGR1_23945 [Agrobacterium sp. B1(2019)]